MVQYHSALVAMKKCIEGSPSLRTIWWSDGLVLRSSENFFATSPALLGIKWVHPSSGLSLDERTPWWSRKEKKEERGTKRTIEKIKGKRKQQEKEKKEEERTNQTKSNKYNKWNSELDSKSILHFRIQLHLVLKGKLKRRKERKRKGNNGRRNPNETRAHKRNSEFDYTVYSIKLLFDLIQNSVAFI